ncbi:MAG: sulfite exporter TauE/SafE family protein [Deltaproteobacteria bacterium]|nr:sulfite exporter TauE/SafE family protein [Candidatus Zymogenaceae bacterium]
MVNVLFLLLISIPVGFIGALTGIGGASILVPLLIILGIPVKQAIATGMITIIATSAGATMFSIHKEITNIKIAMFLEIFTITGAIIGATITTIIAPVYLYFFFAFFLFTTFLKFDVSDETGNGPSPSRDRLSRLMDLKGSYFDESSRSVVDYTVKNTLTGGLGMFFAGTAAGMLGIGAGAFKVSIQEKILGMPTKVASTTSNFIIGMTALAGTSVYLFSGLINTTVTAPLMVGTTIGAVAGGRFLNKVPDRTLKIVFFFIIVLLISEMLYKGFSSL